MIPEFIDFCKSLFPSIDPYTAERAKTVMSQFENSSFNNLAKLTEEFDCIQGDIFSEIPFVFVDEYGNVNVKEYKAQLISNTCDAVRDDNLLFAAVKPIDELSENQSLVANIKRNKIFSDFYLPDRHLNTSFTDFEMITTMSREMFQNLASEHLIRRIATLNSVGYYMFICKLTVFFMRPEDVETNLNRQ